MRNPRVHLEIDLQQERRVTLPEAARHYLTRVLRLPDGAACRVFDGRGCERHAQLIIRGRNAAELELGGIAALPTTPARPLRLLQAVIKAEAMDFAIQKAVELGVSILYPVLTERSLSTQGHRNLERREAHWLGVIQSACEQCGRNELPGLEPPRDLRSALDSLPAGDLRFVASAAGHSWRKWAPHLRPARQAGPGHPDIASVAGRHPEARDGIAMGREGLTLLVGPEGGLTEAEGILAGERDFRPLALGPRTLRSETAAVAALTALQMLGGNWDSPTGAEGFGEAGSVSP